MFNLFDQQDHRIIEGEAELNNLSDHSNICHSAHEKHYIRAARNTKNKWQFIINIPGAGANQTFTQTIPMTICSAPDLACGHGDLVEVETLCKQEYREIKLLVFTRDRRLTLDTFIFKSCCVCFIKTAME